MDMGLIRQMLGLPELLDVPNALVIEPHPDDNEVGAGGTVKRLAERNVPVAYLTVTDGRLGSEDPGMSAEEMVRLRMGERQRANQLLGVQSSFNLGFEDGGDWTESALMQVLVPLIRQFRPALVMTVDPWTPYEAHPDHVKTGRAVASSLIYCQNGIYLKGQGDPWTVPQVAFYGSAYPNTYIDVTETWETKLQAMKAHTSQFDNADWDLFSGFLTAEAERLYREHVSPSASGYAEAFKVLSPRQLHFFPEAYKS
jgi:LmbE family N-acetylglucosaminyl deacetylase